mgnify:CR=1 FL=1|tara:strand:+ start:34794 stop:35498 length:705 start_codon:yes stop_codon:yes gene_type:complete
MNKRTILITGATKGIGLATTEMLLERGYDVVGIARTDNANYPGQFYKCDLSDAEQTKRLLAEIKHEHSIDGVVNNVGLVMPELIEDVTLDNLHKVFDLNVRTAVQVVQMFLAGMKEQRWGRIVNITSRSMLGAKKRTSYSAAKAALAGCTRTWALELAEFGITSNAVAPGPIATELLYQARPKGSADYHDMLDDMPVGRIGEPIEVAEAIAYLISENSGFITGQTLHVDGGKSL